MKKILSALVVGVALAVPAVGLADPVGPSTVATTVEDDSSYGYIFKDDLLDGKGLDMNSALISVRARGLRSNLIKPRLSFVPELYKSVENL